MPQVKSPMLQNKVAIITGAASGIGQGVALRFIKEGAKVVIADIDDARGQVLVKELGANARYKHTDVTDEAAVKALVDFAVQEFGTLDIMHNNAGAFGARGSLLEIDGKGFDFTYALLVKSVFLGMKYAGLAMKEKGGAIVNTASISATKPGYGPHLYQGAKAAVRQLTKSVALEFAQYNIRVNCFSPGGVYTPLIGNAFGMDEATTKELGKGMGALLPLGRQGTPDDMADAVVYLCSDLSAYITGQDLIVDGAEGLGTKWKEQGLN
jgi:NAD(P)-dependent dehydrogenase (short-subunit alcohol dehydrogenase family)